MICGSAGSKSRLAKAADAEPCRQSRQEKLHATVARSTFPSKNAKKLTVSEHYVQKLHAAVARNTFASQNV